MEEERALHEAKLAKMEAEMKMVFQQKVQEKEAKLKQSEEELYARHREMRDALEKQRLELEDKKRRFESGRPLTPTDGKNVRNIDIEGRLTTELVFLFSVQEKQIPAELKFAWKTRWDISVLFQPMDHTCD